MKKQKEKNKRKKQILVFGNPLIREDCLALKVARALQKAKINGFSFHFVNSPEELEKFGKDMLIMDVAEGLRRVRLLKGLNSICLSPRITTHDFDLAFNLKLLKKTGRISSVAFIAIPERMQFQEAVFSVSKLLEELSDKNV